MILVFAAVLGSVCMVAFHHRRGPDAGPVKSMIKPVVVRALTLEKRPYSVTEFFYGLIEANTRVDMAFQVAGRISQLGSEPSQSLVENQIVSRGDMIARLESDRYEAAVEQAKASIETAKASMSAARAEIDRVNAELQDAKDDLDRFRELLGRNASTQREVDKAELRVQVIRAQLDSARAQLVAAQAEYRSARAASRMANVNLQDTELRAPMDATVAAIPVEIGQMVATGDAAVTLVDLSRVKLVIGVVERKLPLLRQGQEVAVEVMALTSHADLVSDSPKVSRTQKGVITMVPPAADRQTGLFDVEIELKNDDGLLFPGMIGKATVTVMEQQAVAIPASVAIRSGDEASAFFITYKHKAGSEAAESDALEEIVPVAQLVWFTPIVFDKDYYIVKEVPEGLDRLIVEGHTRLRDGQAVKEVEPLVSAPVTTPN